MLGKAQGWPALAQELISAFPVDRWFRSMKKPDSGMQAEIGLFYFGKTRLLQLHPKHALSSWTNLIPLRPPLQVIFSANPNFMAQDVYLIRRTANPRSVKYSAVTEVVLSGLRTAYAAVTGNSGTGVVTITGSTMADGMQVIFTSLTGGSSLSTGVAYFAVNSSGATCKLATTEGGTAIALGSNITAGSAIVVNPQFRVWSSEFRDVFTGLGVQGAASAGSSGGSSYNAALGAPQGFGIYADPNAAITGSLVTSGVGFDGYLEGTPKATVSDDVGHYPLRQTLVNRTFWIFDRGASAAPRYLYAEYQAGDVIADNAPTQ